MKKIRLIILYLILVFCFLGSASAIEKKIVISGTEWEPYNGKDLLNQGFYTEISRSAFESVGYEVKIVLQPWKRVFEKTKKGEFHALMGASYTKERTDFFAYPDYAWENKVHFFARTGHSFKYEAIESLCPSKLGILRGSFYVKIFEKYPCLKQDLASSVKININKLISGRMDLLIDSADSFNFIINKYFKNDTDKVTAIQPPYQIDKIYTVFSKRNSGYKMLIADFDRGIKLIKNNGTYDQILKKHDMM
jgi:polar amino acid transport system substrate-binding protein